MFDINSTLNLLLFLCNALMVFLTYRIVRINKTTVEIMSQQIQSSKRPYIQIKITPKFNSLVILEIKNTGISGAKNLKLSINKPFYTNGNINENIQDKEIFQKISSHFGPQFQISLVLGAGHTILNNEKLCPSNFSIAAEYEFDGEKVKEETEFDLSILRGSAAPLDDPYTTEFKKINTNLQKISSNLNSRQN